jgi:hypothetical protein
MVDAPSTRDIDDALSVLPAGPDGAPRLLVSIADVGEHVAEGSAQDVEARERATSVYLAGRVLPMLPEELSSRLRQRPSSAPLHPPPPQQGPHPSYAPVMKQQGGGSSSTSRPAAAT